MAKEPGQPPEDNVGDELTPEEKAQKEAEEKAKAKEGDKLPEDHKFHGKSATDIAKAYDELEGKLGEQGQKISDLENSVTWYQTQAEQRKAQEQERQKPKEEWTDEDDERFHRNPRKFIQEQLVGFYQQARYANVPYDYQDARRQAYEGNPEFAKGIEKEVDFLVDQSLRQGYIRPENAKDPKNFYRAAELIRREKEGYKPAADQTVIHPVDAVGTLKPAGAKPDGDRPKPTVKITEDMKKAIEYLGEGEVSMDEATEMAKEARKEREEAE